LTGVWHCDDGGTYYYFEYPAALLRG
jgi:protocatechuate 3,4-dioxygenase beta subunit